MTSPEAVSASPRQGEPKLHGLDKLDEEQVTPKEQLEEAQDWAQNQSELLQCQTSWSNAGVTQAASSATEQQASSATERPASSSGGGGLPMPPIKG